MLAPRDMPGEFLSPPKGTTDYLAFGCVGVENLSGSTTVDLDYRTENSNYTARIKNARFIALPLE